MIAERIATVCVGPGNRHGDLFRMSPAFLKKQLGWLQMDG